MKITKVYIDTNILKFTSTKLPRFRPRQQKINWGGHEHELTVNDFVHVNPNDFIENQQLKEEVELLPELAEVGRRGWVKYVIQMETLLESWGIPNMDSATGRFYGTPCDTVDAPIKYERVVFSGQDNTRDLQFDFLAKIKSKRFAELQKMTGAYQGHISLNRNQLLDAFHLWCAEHNKCDYFLTIDFKLIRMLRLNRKLQLQVKVVRPSELLAAVKEQTTTEALIKKAKNSTKRNSGEPAVLSAVIRKLKCRNFGKT